MPDICAREDSGIVDPVAADIRAALAPDRASKPYRLAADLLLGVDAFGVELIDAFRDGTLFDGAPASAGSARMTESS